jgi:hypothetical protein
MACCFFNFDTSAHASSTIPPSRTRSLWPQILETLVSVGERNFPSLVVGVHLAPCTEEVKYRGDSLHTRAAETFAQSFCRKIGRAIVFFGKQLRESEKRHSLVSPPLNPKKKAIQLKLEVGFISCARIKVVQVNFGSPYKLFIQQWAEIERNMISMNLLPEAQKTSRSLSQPQPLQSRLPSSYR